MVAQDARASDRTNHEIRIIYHSIRPSKALAPLPDSPANISEQESNEIAWSQLLVSRILPLVLPPEDLQNPCLNVLVSEIFSEIIVHSAICGRGSEAWVIWEGVTKLIRSLRPAESTDSPLADDTVPLINGPDQPGLLSSAETRQRGDLRNAQPGRMNFIAQSFWAVLHLVSLSWSLLRTLAKALMHESSIPARSSRGERLQTSDKVSVTAHDTDSRPNPQHFPDRLDAKRPVVSMEVWSCISRLTSLEHRMPWTFGFLSLLQWLSLHGRGKVCQANGALDR